jgi:hypothetical protein
MIDSLVELFVERVPVVRAQGPVAPLRLLVVDACTAPHHAPSLLGRVESIAPVKSHLVGSAELDRLPEVAHFDLVWLLADADDDLAYPQLLRGDLADRLGLETSLVTVPSSGVSDERSQLAAAHFGRCPAWRRRKGLAEGAQRVATMLDAGTGAA